MYTSSLFQSPAAFSSIRDTLEDITLHFTYLMRLKSQDLYEHSIRVANFAGATAIRMRLPANEVMLIHYAGLLHDIGLLTMANRSPITPISVHGSSRPIKSIPTWVPICWKPTRHART